MTRNAGQNGRALVALALAAAFFGASPREPAAAQEAASAGQTVVAARAIRARSLIGPADVAVEAGETPGALSALDQAIGMEARGSIYPGNPLRMGDVGPPALVDRNSIVTMRYQLGLLEIEAEGRALGRAGFGERVRVMNLDSKATVTGRVAGPNVVEVR
ncbi:flagellar basal body P-ring formation chaperone FlgA [Rubrimonas cliftonensis]|uniref:Flagella basal body P-ring formation protein FlgA n=1 Tax=Rubrimonas cliftonensis TaxID=89524 RepID=A0A1H4C710_9RHOB|nr:flagellar basal body P-ring formation chaperone FlgA [Rubrimonas cliftonensis]SEA56136.1 flagella basal body P-ring formation protein FlgA [Rubrimonas cliftonensis]